MNISAQPIALWLQKGVVAQAPNVASIASLERQLKEIPASEADSPIHFIRSTL